MGRAHRRQHEPAANHVQHTFRVRSPVYRYLVVGQKVNNKGVMMLRCTFCNKVFQGTQFQATRHFTQTNSCKDVSDEALYEIARRTQQKFEADQMERVVRYAAERGLDVPGTGGARGGEAGRRPVEGGVGGNGGHGAPDPPLGGGGCETEEGVIHVDREARGPGEEGVPKHEDVPEFYPGTGRGWRTSGGEQARELQRRDLPRGRKEEVIRLPPHAVSFNAFRNQAWKAYQHVLLEQRGSSPHAVLPNHSEIASMRAVETHRAELAEDLEEVRQPFWVTGASLLSDGRKSRDGRPIVNFLAADSRGVVVYTTINREGKADNAVHVLQRWVTIFYEFSFGGLQRVNAICTDSASAYVGAARALASPSTPLALRRITWLPCSVHVCNKLLSDMGTSCDAFVDAITRALHEGIHTKKRNQLAFEKVVQLVEIPANVRLTEYRRAGCGYVLPWQRDEGMLDCQAGLEVEHVRSGTRRGMAEEEIARKVALITWDPIRVSAPPSADVVFGKRAYIFRLYPREDDSDKEPVTEAADNPALRIPCEIGETHEDPNSEETRAHTARRAVDQAEREILGGDEEFWDSSSSSGGGDGSSSAAGGGTSGRRSCSSGGEGASSRRSRWRSSNTGGGGGSSSGGGGGTVGSCSGGGVPGPVEEDIAAQAEVQRGGDDERLMQQFLTEELDPFIAGMTPGVARGFGISNSEMGIHLDFDSSMGLPPSCGRATSTDRAPSRDEAAGQTLTQTVRERTMTESPDAARDIMERERPRLLASSNPRAQAFARALEEARLRETGGDCVQGGVVAGVGVAEGVAIEAVDEAMLGGAEAADVAVEGRPQAVDEVVQAGQRRVEGAIDARRVVQETATGPVSGLGPRGARTTAAREVPASGCEPQRGRGRGVSTESLEYALRATMRAVQEQTPRKRGVTPRPRPLPAEGRTTLGESLGAEGLGMPLGSRHEQTVAEASARVVVLRKGGGPVTIEEDDPDTDAAVREADEDYEGEEGEEESKSGFDGDDYDDYDEPPPPPGPPPTRVSTRSAGLLHPHEGGRGRHPALEGVRGDKAGRGRRVVDR
ncbi:hypothetical protein CBR_g49249 [Chara braunii]|uniref:DUF659 domain-containing protein n=1 Tax=Chara braunii TaxID=69332 RepID=A0A388M4E9_CHABU|nr:hypothetical protein CBR_g49249 [Chara braunii]|eukprot:GBG89458.1 hypothetical protein CBR_g49249 [Chara braunii]